MENNERPSTIGPNGFAKRFFDWMRAGTLRRQRGWFGGVCAGIGARVSISTGIVRLIFVATSFFAGAAIVVYAALWLILPDCTGKIYLENILARE